MKTFTNMDIMARHRVKNQGGIRKSNTNKCFVLIINDNIERYYDSSSRCMFDILYQGEFIRGKKTQIMDYGNKQLAECGDWPLHVYMRTDSKSELTYVYIGEYMKSGSHVYKNDSYFFPIRRNTRDIVYTFDSFEY